MKCLYAVIPVIIVAALLLGVVTLSGCDGIWIGSNTYIGITGAEEKPALLEVPSVILSTLPLQKSTFAEHKQLGVVSDIENGDYLPEEGLEWALVSDTGALFLNGELAASKFISLDSHGSHIDIITQGAEKKPFFMKRGGWAEPPGLVDLDAKVLWKINVGEGAANDMAAGDLDNDGQTEFVVGYNGGEGIGLYDAHGGLLWKKNDSNVWQVAMVDIDGQGSIGILHSNSGGNMTLRDSQGNIRSQAPLEAYFSNFSVCSWPGQGKRSHVLYTQEGFHWIFDCLGTKVAKLSTNGVDGWASSFGTPVKFSKEGGASFAILTEYSMWDVSVLWIYDESNALVYQEVMKGRGAALLAVPDETTGTDQLLVGGEGMVLSYSLSEGASS